jgi:hypothetical protein
MPQRKIVQLLAVRDSLIALTDTSEIWILQGIGTMTTAPPRAWQRLAIELPEEEITALPATLSVW